MAHPRGVIWPALVAGACLTGCGRDAPRGADTTHLAVTVPDSAVVTGEWPGELGAILLVPSDTDNLAVVVYPVATGSRALADSGVALLSSSGDVVRRRVGLSAEDSLRCGDASLVRLARATPLTWTIGIHSAIAIPLRADSMDALSAADSAAYAAEMARLASAVGAQHATRFTGLPFTVATLRRFRIEGREVVVAQVVRRLNQEANPLEERSLIVAERPSAARGPFTMVHSARSDGSEDNIDHFDLLAALRTAERALVVIARERPTGTTFDILERDAAGAWTVKWSRSIAC